VRIRAIFFLFFVVCLFTCICSLACAEETGHKHDAAAGMGMHHIHIVLTHGLVMVTEGADLIMLADMKMAPYLDRLSLENGHHLMTSGKQVIDDMLNGPEMAAMKKEDFTHKLGKAIMNTVDMLEKMSMDRTMTPDMMTMHHMHIMINHALAIAAEGANMVMLAQSGRANGIDKYSADHGSMMIRDAHALLDEIFGGKAMTEMHTKGIKKDNDMMADTHKLGEAAAKVIDLLEKMPAAAR